MLRILVFCWQFSFVFVSISFHQVLSVTLPVLNLNIATSLGLARFSYNLEWTFVTSLDVGYFLQFDWSLACGLS